MVRKIAAAALGIITAGLIVWIVEALGHAVYPVPPDLDMSAPEQFRDYIAALPPGAFLFVLAAWLLGTLGGGMLACFIAGEKPFVYATIVGAFILIATVVNLVMLPHPLWFSATAVLAIAVMTYLTGLAASSQARFGGGN
ncbi:MAG: hypothetical protein ACE5FV_05210 [Woeseia sp.]